MSTAAWDALATTTTVQSIEVRLLARVPTLPASMADIDAATASGATARLLPGWLTLDIAGAPLRRYRCKLEGFLDRNNGTPVSVVGAALFYLGQLIAIAQWPVVELDHINRYMVAPIDLVVVSQGGGS